MLAVAVIALIGSLVTVLTGYACWRVLSGRAIRNHGDTLTSGKTEPEKNMEAPESKERWGVGEKSYCYPDMNDVMGYEFITVVRIPDSLRADGASADEVADPRPTGWGESSGVGLRQEYAPVTTDAAQDRRGDPDNMPPYPERGGGTAGGEVSEVDIDPRDLEDFIRLGDWASHDEETGFGARPDEEVLAALDASPDTVSGEPLTEEDMREAARTAEEARLVRQYDEMRARYHKRDPREGESVASSILREIDKISETYDE